MIGMDGEKNFGYSMLTVQLDDDDNITPTLKELNKKMYPQLVVPLNSFSRRELACLISPYNQLG